MLDWWRQVNWWIKAASLVLGLLVALGGAVKAWPVIEFMFPAHRGLVYEKVWEVQVTTNELLIWKSEDTIARAKSERDSWEIQIKKEPESPAHDLIKRRIEQLDRDTAQQETRIRQLRGQ